MPDRLGPTLRRAVGTVLIGVVSAVPLPYGSASLGWVQVWLAVVAFIVTAQALLVRRPQHILPLAAIGTLGLGLVTLVWLQTVPVPSSLFANPAWERARDLGIEGLRPRIAIEAGAPFDALAAPLLLMLAFTAGYLQASRRVFAWHLVAAISISGAGYILLGLVAELSNPGHVLLERKVAYRDNLTASFVNRNTAATYIGVCALAAFTLAFRAWRRRWPAGSLPASEILRFVAWQLTSMTAVWSGLAVLLLAATLLTGSRAGTAATLLSVILLTIMLGARAFEPARGRRLWLVLLPVAGLMVLVEALGGGSVLTRVWAGFGQDGRVGAWADAIALLQRSPWLGSGLGTFKDAFPAVRSDGAVGLVWERAHSTPLEIAIELGIPAAVVAALAWAVAMAAFATAYRDEEEAYALPALAFSVMMLAGCHGLVDFSMQIMGCGVPIAVLLGSCLRQSLGRAESPPIEIVPAGTINDL